MPTTTAMTRRLNGSRVNPGITRGENWAEPCCMISSATENVMLAKVIVAAATVDSTARALSTVASPAHVPTSTPTAKRAPTKATTTATAGSTKKLERMESAIPRRRSTLGNCTTHRTPRRLRRRSDPLPPVSAGGRRWNCRVGRSSTGYGRRAGSPYGPVS